MLFFLSDEAQKHLYFLELGVRGNMLTVITHRNTQIHSFLDSVAHSLNWKGPQTGLTSPDCPD